MPCTVAGVSGVQGPVEADADGGAVEAHHYPGHHEPPLVFEGPPTGHARNERTATGIRQCQVRLSLLVTAYSSNGLPNCCCIFCLAPLLTPAMCDVVYVCLGGGVRVALHIVRVLAEPANSSRNVNVCAVQWRTVQAVDAGDTGPRERMQCRDGSRTPACGGGMTHAAREGTGNQTLNLMR